MPSWPAAAGASASRRRSFTTDVSGGGGGGGGIAGPDYDAVSRPRDRGASLGGSSTATAQGLSVDRGSGSHSTPDTQGVAVPQGGPGDALAVDPPAGGGSGGLGSLRARRTSNGGRSGGALLPSAVTGDVKGVSGGGDWGLTGAMRKAEAGELRLLRGGNREIISPLQVLFRFFFARRENIVARARDSVAVLRWERWYWAKEWRVACCLFRAFAATAVGFGGDGRGRGDGS